MKNYITLFGLIIISACSSRDNVVSDSLETTSLDSNSLQEQPVKTIIDFLKWYSANQDIQATLVNNASGESFDSTKFYSINFEETEKYLSKLKSTGYVSEKYLAKWENYFKKCEEDFKSNPSNEGPPDGFDYDFVMNSQDYEEDLKNIEKSKVGSSEVLKDKATIELCFFNGDKLTYTLTSADGKWMIDDIERKK